MSTLYIKYPANGANGITSLTGDVSATGPGAAVATVNSVGGSSASSIHSAELAANAATSSNTASTIVKRDASGIIVVSQVQANGVTVGSAANTISGLNTVNSNVNFSAGATILGIISGSNSATGNIGQYQESLVTSLTNVPASAAWGDATSLSLTAGNYAAFGITAVSANGATLSLGFDVGISITTGNSSTGLSFPKSWSQTTSLPVIGGNAVCLGVNAVNFTFSTTTTIYLKHRFNYSVGTPQYQAALWVYRIS